MKASTKILFSLLAAAPISALAQTADVAGNIPAVVQHGQHFGLSDSIWLGIFMSTATLFTVIILTINTTIRNLAETSRLWRPNKSAMLIFALLASQMAFAQGADVAAPEVFSLSDTAFWAMAAAVAFLAVFTILQLGVLRGLTKKIAGVESTEPVYVEGVRRETAMSKLWDVLNGHVAIEKEKDIMLDHNYDGIRELDNQLPPWWKYGFYLTIVIGVLYLIHYHVTHTGLTQKEEYLAEVEQAEADVAAYLLASALNVDESTVTFDPTDARVADGKNIFIGKCKVCHGEYGQGGVGPNLTDAYWINGGGISNVFKTVKYGVPAKGMQSWKATLSPTQIQNVATFILTLEGTNPADAKAPQGDLYVKEGEATETPDTLAAPADSTITAAVEPTL
jgi:cytochrome c oxidase cbb3-type subunit III